MAKSIGLWSFIYIYIYLYIYTNLLRKEEEMKALLEQCGLTSN
jgi:hypothetical protein